MAQMILMTVQLMFNESVVTARLYTSKIRFCRRTFGVITYITDVVSSFSKKFESDFFPTNLKLNKIGKDFITHVSRSTHYGSFKR